LAKYKPCVESIRDADTQRRFFESLYRDNMHTFGQKGRAVLPGMEGLSLLQAARVAASESYQGHLNQGFVKAAIGSRWRFDPTALSEDELCNIVLPKSITRRSWDWSGDESE